jgi:hypothetical protein
MCRPRTATLEPKALSLNTVWNTCWEFCICWTGITLEEFWSPVLYRAYLFLFIRSALQFCGKKWECDIFPMSSKDCKAWRWKYVDRIEMGSLTLKKWTCTLHPSSDIIGCWNERFPFGPIYHANEIWSSDSSGHDIPCLYTSWLGHSCLPRHNVLQKVERKCREFLWNLLTFHTPDRSAAAKQAKQAKLSKYLRLFLCTWIMKSVDCF